MSQLGVGWRFFYAWSEGRHFSINTTQSCILSSAWYHGPMSAMTSNLCVICWIYPLESYSFFLIY
jgi:hypothetical protein